MSVLTILLSVLSVCIIIYVISCSFSYSFVDAFSSADADAVLCFTATDEVSKPTVTIPKPRYNTDDMNPNHSSMVEKSITSNIVKMSLPRNCKLEFISGKSKVGTLWNTTDIPKMIDVSKELPKVFSSKGPAKALKAQLFSIVQVKEIPGKALPSGDDQTPSAKPGTYTDCMNAFVTNSRAHYMNIEASSPNHAKCRMYSMNDLGTKDADDVRKTYFTDFAAYVEGGINTNSTLPFTTQDPCFEACKKQSKTCWYATYKPSEKRCKYMTQPTGKQINPKMTAIVKTA